MSDGAGFTPGPWTVGEYGISSSSGYNDVARARDGHVYDAYDSDPATIEFNNPTDASLIAAAPELYARLCEAREAIAFLHKDALGWVEEPEARWPVREEMLHHIDAALAKARGEAA